MGFPYVGITYCVGGWGIFGVWRILSPELGTVVFGLNTPPPSTKKSLLTRGDLKRNLITTEKARIELLSPIWELEKNQVCS